MNAYLKSRFFVQSLLIFVGMPLILWALGNLPERSLLKEAISVLTLLAFFQMVA